MAQQTINIGTAPNDGTGTPLRTSFDYCNLNFTELYTAVGPSGNNIVVPGTATITGDLTVRSGNKLILNRADNAISTQLNDAGSGAGFTVNNLNGDGILLKVASNDVYRINSSYVQTWLDGAGGTRMTLNSTGLGVGAVPTVAKVQTNGAFATNGAVGNISGTPLANALIGDFSTTCRLIATGANTTTAGVLKFINASSDASVYLESMTLDASGNLLVGTTGAIASGSTFQNLGAARQVLTLKNDDATSYTLGLWSATTTGDNFFAYFGTEASTTVRGSVTYNRAGGLVAYNTTSDYRAKDIIGPVSNSGSLIDSLKVYVGKMHGATIERPMLIAHEAQEVAPYAVTGTKDEVDADGNPKYQQMDVSALVPVLIAEIQSLRTRVAALEA